MFRLLLEIAFMIFWISLCIIRYPHNKRNGKNNIIKSYKTVKEKCLLGFTFIGIMIFPCLYVSTPLFNFANYNLPVFLGIIGLVLLPLTLWLFYRSHKDLGLNWSATLEVREKHTLVTQGIYTYIRHPMYTSIWLWVICQALLIQNYITGFFGILSFGLLYFLRVDNEESMMENQFGKTYLEYKQRTKRLIPFVI